jgi:tellurite resistance protein TerC
MGFPVWTVSIFIITFVLSLIIDLVQHRNAEEITFRNSVIWSIFWIALSISFYGWLLLGPTAYVLGDATIDPRIQTAYANLFLAGYVLEKTLSVDNLMVFIAIFKFFNIKDVLQHRILYFGILGAIVFRGIFVVLGTLLLQAAGYAEIIFGLLVFYAAWQMWVAREEEEEEKEDPNYEEMWLVQTFNRFYPIHPKLEGKRFFLSRAEVQEKNKDNPDFEDKPSYRNWMTPAFVCLLVIEGSDVLFAVDSVPAVMAITKEPLLVFSSMIFAILGLRSLYFVLLALTKYLVHIETAVIGVLVFIGIKMFIHAYVVFHCTVQDLSEKALQTCKESADFLPSFLHISPNMSMAVVLSLLTLGVIASFIWPEKEEDKDAA